MITISNKALFRTCIFSIFIFLFNLLCIAWFEDVFSGILLLVIVPILTVISSIYLVRRKLLKENKKFLFLLPSIGFIIALILSILLQIYFVNIDPYHSGQISIYIILPFFSLAYIGGAIVINFIIAIFLSFLLNSDKIQFKEITQYSIYKSLSFFIIQLLIFIFILYTPYIKDPELKNIEVELQIQGKINKKIFELKSKHPLFTTDEDIISYCEGLDTPNMVEYCFKTLEFYKNSSNYSPASDITTTPSF